MPRAQEIQALYQLAQASTGETNDFVPQQAVDDFEQALSTEDSSASSSSGDGLLSSYQNTSKPKMVSSVGDSQKSNLEDFIELSQSDVQGLIGDPGKLLSLTQTVKSITVHSGIVISVVSGAANGIKQLTTTSG